MQVVNMTDVSPSTIIRNPVLRGFNPDPSVLRVGEDFYIATSTFEWFPGVQIHQSRDLVHWRLLTRPLTRSSQLDMLGDPDSGGVWAPCLSYADGLFYLVYTDVKVRLGAYKVAHNYLVTAPDILGCWSDPVYLNSSGFDPSLFHDTDNRKWLLNMLWDHRQDQNRFGGIVAQQYDPEEKRLVGTIHNIFRGTKLGKTEGPHLYRRNGYYYLLTAEGGTGIDHAVSLARSTTIQGPYEVAPENPILTSAGNPEAPLAKAGHASLVETENGEWYMAYLCARPIGAHGRCILGRETALHPCEWTDAGWLQLKGGGKEPALTVAAPDLPPHPFEREPEIDEFDGKRLNINFQSLRVPIEEHWLSLKARPGWLRLYAQEAPTSLHRQSLIARRIQSFHCEAATCLMFDPRNFQQMAGLICYYNTRNHYYLRVGYEAGIGKILSIVSMDRGEHDEPIGQGIPWDGGDRIFLKAKLSGDRLQFAYSRDNAQWPDIGGLLDATILSDDYDLSPRGIMNFTGAFVGICAHDMSGQKIHADFDWFVYKELGNQSEAEQETGNGT